MEPNQYQQPSQNYQYNNTSGKVNKSLIYGVISFSITFLIGLGLVAWFIYIPNRPENAWKTGMDRSGDLLQKLALEAANLETVESIKRSQITANATINYGQDSYQAQLETKFDELDSETSLKVMASATEMSSPLDLAMNLVTISEEGSRFPDVYFKLAGIKGTDYEPLLMGFEKYDDKWIFASSDYLEKEFSAVTDIEAESTQPELTAEQINELVNTSFQSVTEYLLTSDESKAVIVNKQYLGKDEIDGRKQYHYLANLNLDNMVAFCNDAADRLLSTEAFNSLSGIKDDEIEQTKNEFKDDCEELKTSEAPEDFEIWLDARYKIISRVRIFDPDDKNKYVDFGQKYAGGDELPMYIDFSKSTDDFSKGSFTLTTNLKQSTTKAELTVASKEDAQDKWSAEAMVEVKAVEGELNLQPPEDVVNFEKIIKEAESTLNDQLYPEDYSSYSNDDFVLGINSDDDESVSDIQNLYDMLTR